MTSLDVVSIGLAASLVAGVGTRAANQHDAAGQHRATPLAIPESIKVEHEEIHGELAAIEKTSGRTGAAAGHVAELLQPHFASEEQFALLPLGPASPAGGRPTDARDAGCDCHDGPPQGRDASHAR